MVTDNDILSSLLRDTSDSVSSLSRHIAFGEKHALVLPWLSRLWWKRFEVFSNEKEENTKEFQLPRQLKKVFINVNLIFIQNRSRNVGKEFILSFLSSPLWHFILPAHCYFKCRPFSLPPHFCWLFWVVFSLLASINASIRIYDSCRWWKTKRLIGKSPRVEATETEKDFLTNLCLPLFFTKAENERVA